MKVLVIGLLVLSSLSALAGQKFTGIATAQGTLEGQCKDIDVHPTKKEALKDAKKQADEFCDTFNLKSVLASTVIYDHGCAVKGRGFAVHREEYVKATASFNCR